jgi:hypothetical protein
MAAVVELGVIVSFLLFRRAPWVAGLMLVTFASCSYVLQKLHAEHVNHPLFISGIVPAALVLGGIALHLIKPPKTEPAAPAQGDSASPRTAMPKLAPEPREVETRTPAKAGNGALSGGQKAALIIGENPALSNAEVASRAGVTDRTVRTVRAKMREEASR